MKAITLREVTLLGIDCLDVERLAFAIDVSQRHIQFGEVKILSHLPSDRPDVIAIAPITTKEQYSRFVIKELHAYVTTSYVLLVQWDGFILNPFAWNERYLDYDYVGAPWAHYDDGMNVGNGGFSLRSRRLLEHVAHDLVIDVCHPEDEVICRQFGARLQARAFRFAPEQVARGFSVEGEKWAGQFGFHRTDISQWSIHDFVDEQKHAEHVRKFYRYFPRKS